MKVQVKLLATLRSKLPMEARGSTVLEMEPGATVATVLEHLGIAETQVHGVMVNDAVDMDRQRALADGDAVVLLPPVAGG
jgi:molybdopterin converting factor small subunit